MIVLARSCSNGNKPGLTYHFLQSREFMTCTINSNVTIKSTTKPTKTTMAKRSPEDDVQVAIEEENRVNGSYDDAEEDDDDEAHQHQQRKKKKKKKRKVRIMTASDQTDADRRVLRRRQRELHTDISFDAPAAAASASAGANNDSSEDDNNDDETKPMPSTSGLLSWREKNNALWDDVRYTREAVLDSENMDLISSKAAREVEKIIQVRCSIMTLLIGVTDIFYFVVVHHVCSFNDNAMESYHLDNLLPYVIRSHATTPSL